MTVLSYVSEKIEDSSAIEVKANNDEIVVRLRQHLSGFIHGRNANLFSSREALSQDLHPFWNVRDQYPAFEPIRRIRHRLNVA